MKWTKMRGAGPNDIECATTVFNEADKSYDVKFSMCVFDLPNRESNREAHSRYRGHIYFGPEIYRCYAPTQEEATRKLEERALHICTEIIKQLPITDR